MMEHAELATRLLIAAGLGSLIGAERERLVWAAGLRTHMLVSVGACLFAVVSAYGFSAVIRPGVVLDPSRISAQIVSGIGFLGAGSILLRGDVVRGLTTAASLWSVAAIGLAVGSGLYLEAAAATIIILVILAGIKPLESWYQKGRQTHEIRMRVDRGKMSLDRLNDALGYRARRIVRYVSSPSENPQFEDVSIVITRLSGEDAAEIVRRLEMLPDVREAAKE